MINVPSNYMRNEYPSKGEMVNKDNFKTTRGKTDEEIMKEIKELLNNIERHIPAVTRWPHKQQFRKVMKYI